MYLYLVWFFTYLRSTVWFLSLLPFIAKRRGPSRRRFATVISLIAVFVSRISWRSMLLSLALVSLCPLVWFWWITVEFSRKKQDFSYPVFDVVLDYFFDSILLGPFVRSVVIYQYYFDWPEGFFLLNLTYIWKIIELFHILKIFDLLLFGENFSKFFARDILFVRSLDFRSIAMVFRKKRPGCSWINWLKGWISSGFRKMICSSLFGSLATMRYTVINSF